MYGKPRSNDWLARGIFPQNILLINFLAAVAIIIFEIYGWNLQEELFLCLQKVEQVTNHKRPIPLIEILCNILADMVGKKKEKQAALELFSLPSTGSWSAQDVIQHDAD